VPVCRIINSVMEDVILGSTPFLYPMFLSRGRNAGRSFSLMGRRHYDPTVGRFLEPDSAQWLDPRSFGGINAYAYCLNDPIAKEDPNGRGPLIVGLLAGAITGAVIGGTYGGLLGVTYGLSGKKLLFAIGIGAIAGAIMGIGSGLGSAVITSGWKFLHVTAWSGKVFTCGAALGLVSGAVGGAMNDALIQIIRFGYIRDKGSIGWSALQRSVVNLFATFATTLGGGAGPYWGANLGLNLVMGFPLSTISFAVDVLRNRYGNSDNEEDQITKARRRLYFLW